MSSDTNVYVYATISLVIGRLVLAGAYHKFFAKIPCVFRLFSSDLPSSVRRKFHENLWYSLWHSFSFVVNAWILVNSTWFKPLIMNWDHQVLRHEYETHAFEPYSRMFYLVSLAFWTSCLFFLGIETVRKDFFQMLMHHIVTVTLIGMSFVFNFHRFGLVVLLLHDVVDIFLYIAKCCMYKKHRVGSDIFFAVFATFFLIARLILLPIYCLIPGYIFSRQVPVAMFLAVLLTFLYCLHIFWWLMIWRLIVKTFNGSAVETDSRSEPELDAKDE